MNQDSLYLFLAAFPIVVGVIIAALNSGTINEATEGAEAWLRQSHTKVSAKQGWLFKYVINPCLFLIVKFSDWSDSLAHRGIKNGVRAAATLYALLAWGFLLYLAISVTIAIVIILAALAVMGFVLGRGDAREDFAYDERFAGGEKAPIGPRGSRLVEEGVFFDRQTGTKIDEDGRVVKEGLFFDSATGMKIDDDGRLVKEGLFFDEATGTKINESGQIVEEGTFFDSPSGTRIDGDGHLVKEGILFDAKTGMKYEKTD